MSDRLSGVLFADGFPSFQCQFDGVGRFRFLIIRRDEYVDKGSGGVTYERFGFTGENKAGDSQLASKRADSGLPFLEPIPARGHRARSRCIKLDEQSITSPTRSLRHGKWSTAVSSFSRDETNPPSMLELRVSHGNPSMPVR